MSQIEISKEEIIAMDIAAYEFFEAGKILFNNRDEMGDIINYPMLFCISHALELKFKAILWNIKYCQDKDKKEKQYIFKTHNIKNLYDEIVKTKTISFNNLPDWFDSLIGNLNSWHNTYYNRYPVQEKITKTKWDIVFPILLEFFNFNSFPLFKNPGRVIFENNGQFSIYYNENLII